MCRGMTLSFHTPIPHIFTAFCHVRYLRRRTRRSEARTDITQLLSKELRQEDAGGLGGARQIFLGLCTARREAQKAIFGHKNGMRCIGGSWCFASNSRGGTPPQVSARVPFPQLSPARRPAQG